MEKENALYNYEEFAECTYLPFQRPMASSEISKFLMKIKVQDIENFIQYVNEEFDTTFKSTNDNRLKYLALDSTSISTYSDNLSDAEYGQNKDGDDLAQINLILLTEQSSGFPLYYKKICGNVTDISTVRNFIADVSRLGLPKDVIYVADRGYPSVQNINDCLTNNFNFLVNGVNR